MKMELYRETAEAGPGVDPSMLRNEMKRKSKTMTSVSADARARASTRARLNRRIWRLFHSRKFDTNASAFWRC